MCVALVLQALFAHGADRSVTDAAAPALLALVQGFPDAFQAAGTACWCHALLKLCTSQSWHPQAVVVMLSECLRQRCKRTLARTTWPCFGCM